MEFSQEVSHNGISRLSLFGTGPTVPATDGWNNLSS